jgi:general stress protein 26
MIVHIMEQKNYCKNVMNMSKVCYLTTINENFMPETRAMLNLRNEGVFPSLKQLFDDNKNEFIVYMTTNTSSSKTGQIGNNPNVSVYYCLPDMFQGVMLSGKMEIENDPEIKKLLWQPNWDIYYPRGMTDPDYTVLKLEPGIIKAYGNLNVYTIQPDGKNKK